MKDSGKRQTFETGAVCDTDESKPRPDLVSPFAMERLGDWLRKGAVKYGEHNYEKGIPISRRFASLYRHLLKFQQGEHDEDHLAAVFCNAMMILHTIEMVRRGVLPATLLDMPKYRKTEPIRDHVRVVIKNGNLHVRLDGDEPSIRKEEL